MNGNMPIRENVSEELLQQLRVVFNRTYTDYKSNTCSSTIALLIIHLYELALVAFTYHYSCGIATYSVVKNHLPNLQTNQEFVKFRDDIVHNLYNIVDFKGRLQLFLQNFTRENFSAICIECGLGDDLYDDLLHYCLDSKQGTLSRINI